MKNWNSLWEVDSHLMALYIGCWGPKKKINQLIKHNVTGNKIEHDWKPQVNMLNNAKLVCCLLSDRCLYPREIQIGTDQLTVIIK